MKEFRGASAAAGPFWRTTTTSPGSLGCAAPMLRSQRRERRHSGSMLSTPDVLRRTGGRPVKSIVFDERAIAERVQLLAGEITRAYPDGDLLVLGLLKGSFIFLSDLVRKIERPIQVDFLVAS